MQYRLASLSALLSAALLGCGGGGDSVAPPPEASASSFAVRTALDGMLADPGINVNMGGFDNTPIDKPLHYHEWGGSFSMSKRVATPANALANCPDADTLVDIRIVLTRSRDGYRIQDGATFGYSADYKPLCALMLDGNRWTWSSSQPLPDLATVRGNLSGIESGGTVTGPSSETIGSLNSLVGLDPDTATSAYISFVYHVRVPSGQPFQMFGETTEFRFKIDPTGKFLGFEYLRTGVLPDPANLDPVVTVRMTSH